MDDNKINYFAETDFRNKKTKFGIKAKDRARHMYVVGKTGMGKSTLLENMAIQDIQSGEGMAFIDPHGGTAEKLLEYVPAHRIKDVVYFAPFDTDYPISFNVMEDVDPDKRHLVASGLMSTFKKIWADAWSARMEYILSNTLLALLEYPGATLLGVNRMLVDKDYRKMVVENISDSAVKSFWVDEFSKYTERYAAEATPAIQNKIGQFTSNPLIRNIIGQPKSSFDIREVMDNKKILIANLSKGRMGEQNTNLLGGMLITKLYLAAMSRADTSPEKLRSLPNFFFYVDEFQSFANESFADILSEARKYKLNLIITHQYIEQMPEAVRNAVFGNVGTTIAFRVGPFDAEVLEKVFSPVFTAEDLVNLGFAQIYLTLMVDGIGSKPFSAVTLPPLPKPETSFTNEIVANSRSVYASTKQKIEDDINGWLETKFLAPSKIEKLEEKMARRGDNDNRQQNDYGRNNYEERGEKKFEKKPYNPNYNKNQNYQNSNVGISMPVQTGFGPSSKIVDRPNQIGEENKTENKPELNYQEPKIKVFTKKMEAISPKLKNILTKLEEEDKNIENENQENKIKPVPVKVSASEEGNKFMSLRELREKKEPTTKNVNLLKEALEKAMKEREIQKKESETKSSLQAGSADSIIKDSEKSVPIEGSNEAKEDDKDSKNSGYQAKKPKEIPEDVLRKVLE